MGPTGSAVTEAGPCSGATTPPSQQLPSGSPTAAQHTSPVRRVAQRDLESGSQAALAAYEHTPTAEILLAGRTLTDCCRFSTQRQRMVRRLAGKRYGCTDLQALMTGSAFDSSLVVLDRPAGRNQGGDVMREWRIRRGRASLRRSRYCAVGPG